GPISGVGRKFYLPHVHLEVRAAAERRPRPARDVSHELARAMGAADCPARQRAVEPGHRQRAREHRARTRLRPSPADRGHRVREIATQDLGRLSAIQRARLCSETSPAARARMTAVACSGGATKSIPFNPRKTMIEANAALLLPSTNGWFLAMPNA